MIAALASQFQEREGMEVNEILEAMRYNKGRFGERELLTVRLLSP